MRSRVMRVTTLPVRLNTTSAVPMVSGVKKTVKRYGDIFGNHRRWGTPGSPSWGSVVFVALCDNTQSLVNKMRMKEGSIDGTLAVTPIILMTRYSRCPGLGSGDPPSSSIPIERISSMAPIMVNMATRMARRVRYLGMDECRWRERDLNCRWMTRTTRQSAKDW